MIQKQPLKTAFIGIKTSQQRLILNELKKDFLVYRTKNEVDVLFVKDDTRDYDIKYTLIFPYSEIILDNLNSIISKVIKPNFNNIRKTSKSNVVNINYNKEKETTLTIEDDTELLNKIDNLIENRKKNIDNLQKPKNILNHFFDEIYFLNGIDNYSGWEKIKKSCLKYNIFITRWECDVLNKNNFLNLLNHINDTTDEKILIIFDNNTFADNFDFDDNLNVSEILYCSSDLEFGGLIITKSSLQSLINDVKHTSELNFSKYKKYSKILLGSN